MKKYVYYACLLILLCIVSNLLLLSNVEAKLLQIKTNLFFEEKQTLMIVDTNLKVKDFYNYIDDNLNEFALGVKRVNSPHLAVQINGLDWYIPTKNQVNIDDLNSDKIVIPNQDNPYPKDFDYASFESLKRGLNENGSGNYILFTNENIDFLTNNSDFSINVMDYQNKYNNTNIIKNLIFVSLLLITLKLMLNYLFKSNHEYVAVSKLLGYNPLSILKRFFLITLFITFISYLVSLIIVYFINQELFNIYYIKNLIIQSNCLFLLVVVIYLIMINLIYYLKINKLSVINQLREDLD